MSSKALWSCFKLISSSYLLLAINKVESKTRTEFVLNCFLHISIPESSLTETLLKRWAKVLISLVISESPPHVSSPKLAAYDILFCHR